MRNHKTQIMKSNWVFFITLLLTIVGAACQSVHATVLTTSMTVDNEFDIYISTNDNIVGTLFGSNSNWPSTTTHNTSLIPNVVNYIYVVGRDAGSIEMFIGQFTLSDTNFHYYGLNGVGPWGFFPSISASAHPIWHQIHNTGGDDTVYFSASITPVVPISEPSTILHIWHCYRGGSGHRLPLPEGHVAGIVDRKKFYKK